MKIELKEITVRELTDGYKDNAENGVVGYGGRLDIRPPFQREFIYKDKQRDAVINTITKDFPLNVMYWAVRENGDFEVIDGQQRTISVCQYVGGDFSYMFRYFHNLKHDEQDIILDYKLMVYICSGTDSEKLEWFKTINIAGEKLTDQELRNAVYSGSWVSDAKKYFSKNGCPAHSIGNDYLNGSSIRQEYLETAIEWISKGNIEVYMANHQHEPNANEIWLYFQSVINWVQAVFSNYRREMKGVEWGFLYNEFKDNNFDSKKLEEEIAKLMEDDDVSKKSGIYSYVLTRKEKYLNIRAFSTNQKREAYERQKGICPVCKEHFEISGMEADHITPWHAGGKTAADNCQMLCKECNRRKSGK
ncbi:MAG: HNH endonuclease [Bacteroidetes bacterium GWE2_29_8]|nr:MAG: HNH endonuclease [Bacteroidetes bacterium GWE2_29_8]OFY18612.1 MAG: HNH endonuclease [Bacteroidetes bacterium GWF2_29_10]